MEHLDRRYRQLQRATVARSALDTIALIFLACAFAFWSVAFWQLLDPPALLSLLSIQAVVLALVYSLATPLLWSALVPTTPAGQLLQKTQWRTIGFYLIIGAALYLSYQAEWMIELWLGAQPAVNNANMARSLAFSLSIAFILIPALAWTQLNPERWLQQIQQAHQVRRLEIQQRGELAIIRARLLWAEQKAAIGFANLLPKEQQEVVATLRGLFTGIADTQRAIARTLSISADLERNVMGDEQIAEHFDYVAASLCAQEIAPPALAARPSETRATWQDDRIASASERAERAMDVHTEPHQTGGSSRVALRQGDTEHDGAYTVAYQAYGRDEAWTIRDLASVLKVAESTARDLKKTWTTERKVSGEGLSNGRYRFV